MEGIPGSPEAIHPIGHLARAALRLQAALEGLELGGQLGEAAVEVAQVVHGLELAALQLLLLLEELALHVQDGLDVEVGDGERRWRVAA